MIDELESVRRLQEGAPAPHRSWVDETRAELVALADEEARHARQPAPEPRLPVGERLLGRLLTALRRPAVATAAALLVVGAVGWAVHGLTRRDRPSATVVQPDVDPGGTPTKRATGNRPGAQLGGRCSDPDGLYAAAYPVGWHTNPGNVIPRCHAFDPKPIALQEGVGGRPVAAITIRTAPVPLEVGRKPGRAARQLSEQPTIVDGHDAVRQELESTGGAALPEGVRSYRYLVDLGERSLLAVTYDLGQPPFEEKKRILDEMIGAVRLDARR